MIFSFRQKSGVTIIESIAWFEFRLPMLSPLWILFKTSLLSVSNGFILPSGLCTMSLASLSACSLLICGKKSSAFSELKFKPKSKTAMSAATFLPPFVDSLSISFASFLKRLLGFMTFNKKPRPSKK